MSQYLKPRSWRIRYEAAKHRAARQDVLADIRAVRVAHYHGEEPPADAVARLAAIEARRLSERDGTLPDPAPAADDDMPAPGDSAAKGPRGRKSAS